MKFVSEFESMYQHVANTLGNLRGLAVYVYSTISVIEFEIKELIINTIYWMNNPGKGLKNLFVKERLLFFTYV